MSRVLAWGFVSLIVLAPLIAVIPAVVSSGGQQGKFSEQRIRFARGVHSATVRGRVSRSRAILYKISAKRGQSMTVELEGDAKTRFDLSGPQDKDSIGRRWYPASRSGPARCRTTATTRSSSSLETA